MRPGRDAAAERAFDRLVEEAKRVIVTDTDDLIALADAYAFFGGVKEAEKALIDAQKAAPKDPRPSLALGFLVLSTDPARRRGRRIQRGAQDPPERG
jgi:Flp pilus assembly protein TadD